MFKTADFNFNLPDELIAHQPFSPKEETKMLIYQNGEISDKQIINLIDFLQEGDVLVFNDAKVIKAKLSGKILRNGAKLDFNLDQGDDNVWQALCRPAKKVETGDEVEIASDFSAKIIEKKNDGFIEVEFNCKGEEKAGRRE